jgi:hypothetical protein
MAKKPTPFKQYRVVTTVISAAIWAVMLYFGGFWIAGGSHVTHVAPIAMALGLFFNFLFIPYFATHSVLMGGLRRVLDAKVVLPDDGVDAGAQPGNAWWASAINALKYGAPPAIAAFVLAINSTSEISARQFAVTQAVFGALLAAVVVFAVGGRPLLQATRVPRGKSRFDSDPAAYLRTHFMIPHAFTNCVLNAAIAFLISPVPFAGGAAMVPTRNVVVDAVITFIILTWLVGSGARSQARTEGAWGIAPKSAAGSQSVLKGFLIPLFGGIGFAVALGVLFTVTHTAAIGIYSWAAFRGIVFGAYTMWLSKSVAQAALGGALAAATPAVPAHSSAA